MDTKKKTRMLMCGLFVAVAGYSYAETESVAGLQTASVPAIQESDSTGETATILPDRLNHIIRRLEGMSAVHLYSFTSIRGQNVLLATPLTQGFNDVWKVEYRQGGGEWTAKIHRAPKLLTSLQPGTQVDVRVSAVEGATADQIDYSLVLGSSPRMNYDLHHEEGLLRVPYGFTKPELLATQAIKQALLEVTFTDSKGQPLEGGVVTFLLKLPERPDDIVKTLVSDASGKASELLKFEPCTGGDPANYFTHRSNGRNTWATRYKVGKYTATNTLLEELADKPHLYNFGHICKRTLVNWSRN